MQKQKRLGERDMHTDIKSVQMKKRIIEIDEEKLKKLEKLKRLKLDPEDKDATEV